MNEGDLLRRRAPNMVGPGRPPQSLRAGVAGDLLWGSHVVGGGADGPVAYEETVNDAAGVSDQVETSAGFDQALADVLAVADAIAKDVATPIADSTGVADGVAPGRDQPIDDTLTVADALAGDVTTSIADSAGVADAIAKDATTPIADTAGVADALAKGVGHSPGDALTVADAPLTASLTNVVINDTAGVADSLDGGDDESGLASFYVIAAGLPAAQRRWVAGAAYLVGDSVRRGESYDSAQARVLTVRQYASAITATELTDEFEAADSGAPN